ncbi:MAG: Sua5/YciO/YrdC/YwlC family protein, partial [Planctomycetota bacterium]
RGGSVGARVPANAIARALIAAAGVRVVAPSANKRGETPACSADEVLTALDGRIDAVVDGGPSNLRQASTVVRFRGCAYEVLREGIITEADIRTLLSLNILFVCTGNSCRSPMAEGMLKRIISERASIPPEALERQGIAIHSAGVSAQPGGSATPEAIGVLAERGVHIRDHAAARLTEKAIRNADAIYGMSPRHVEAVLELDASAKGKTRLLDPEGRSIPDPIGASLPEYRLCADSIERCVRIIADAL